MRTVVVSLVLAASLGGCSSGHKATSSGGAGNSATGNGAAGATAGIGAAGAAAGASGGASAGSDAAGGPGAAGTGTAGGGLSAGSDGGVDTSVDADITARLVPWQVEADGTPPLVMGIYDLQEKVHCRFVPDEAGQLRCLPAATATFTETASFSDAACTKRIYRTDTNVGVTWVDRATALPLPRVACAPHRYVVGTLKPWLPPAAHFGGTPCAQIQTVPNIPSGQTEMTVVDVQAPDRWVKGTQVDGPLIDKRMRLELVEAPDGTRFANELVDEHWSKPCQLVANVDEVFCRAPAALSRVGVAGAQCAGPPVWRVHACDDPVFLGGSIFSPNAVAVGPVWSGPVTISGHGCQQVSASSTIDGPDIFVEEGASITDAMMTPQPWQATGTGRLRLRGLVADDGQVATLPTSLLWSEFDSAVLQGAHARYFDSGANTTCNPIRTPEGQLRCVPTSVALASASLGFADDKCAVPAFYCPGYVASCPGTVAMQVALEANGEVHASSLNTTRVVTTVFLPTADGTCMPNTFTTPGFYALDAAAPWTQFPAFTERNGRAPDGL